MVLPDPDVLFLKHVYAVPLLRLLGSEGKHAAHELYSLSFQLLQNTLS